MVSNTESVEQNTRNKFHSSLQVGRTGEMLFYTQMEKFNIPYIINNNKKTNKFYDCMIFPNDTEIKVEIKYDVMSEKTGNIAIEINNSKTNKPSGLYVTQAKVWCLVLPSLGLFFSKVDNIKQHVIDNLPLRTIIGGGDGNADLLLYKREALLDTLFHKFVDREECVMWMLK